MDITIKTKEEINQVVALAKRVQSVQRGIPNRAFVSDRWENPTSGFGAFGTDPLAGTNFRYGQVLQMQTIDSLYRQSWVANRIIKSMAQKATERDFELESKKQKDADSVKELLDEWHTLKRLEELGIESRLYGGAGEVMRIDDGLDPKYPLREDWIRDLKWTKILNRWFCVPIKWYDDPSSEKFGRPEVFRVHFMFPAIGASRAPMYFHETRINWLNADYLPQHLRLWNFGSGDPVLLRIYDVLRDFGVAMQSVASIIYDFVTKILKLDNLDDLLLKNEAQLQYRISQASAQNSVHSTVVIGKGEEISKISTPVSGLHELVDKEMDLVCAASEMPRSIIFGNTSGTLGSSSGSNDQDNWFSAVKSYREKRLTPPLKNKIRIACLLFRIDPKKIKVVWPKIRELNELDTAKTNKAEAETEKIKAETEQIKKGIKLSHSVSPGLTDKIEETNPDKTLEIR